MNCFLSPLLTVVAKNVAFFAGSLLAVLIALTIYDEDVLAVEHVLSSITLLGVCITVCRCVSVCVLSRFEGFSTFFHILPLSSGLLSQINTWFTVQSSCSG